jgi:NAD(P)-dependent dehydrogenase (short-subunit alcohol dehydrogenase family)
MPAMTTTKRIVLITGANKGIGYETARQLASAGHTVLIGARDPDKAASAVAALASEGLRAQAVTLDVLDAASIERAVAHISEHHGRLDTLINNAGLAAEAWGAPASQTGRRPRGGRPSRPTCSRWPR